MALTLSQYRTTVRVVEDGGEVISSPRRLYVAPPGGGLVKTLAVINDGADDAVVHVRCFSDRMETTEEYRRVKLCLSPGDHVVPWENDVVLERGDQIVVSADADKVSAVLDVYEGFDAYVPSTRLMVVLQGAAGARWSLDGGSTWHASAQSVEVSRGLHHITFSDVAGMITPSPRTVEIRDVGNYVRNAIYYEPGTYRYHFLDQEGEEPLEIQDIRTLRLGGYSLVADGRLYEMAHSDNPYTITGPLEMRDEEHRYDSTAGSVSRFTQSALPLPRSDHHNMRGEERTKNGLDEEFDYAARDDSLFHWTKTGDLEELPIKERQVPEQEGEFNLAIWGMGSLDGTYQYKEGEGTARVWEVEGEAPADPDDPDSGDTIEILLRVAWDSGESRWELLYLVKEGDEWVHQETYAHCDAEHPYSGEWVIIVDQEELAFWMLRSSEDGMEFEWFDDHLDEGSRFTAFSGILGDVHPNIYPSGQAMVITTDRNRFIFKHGYESQAQLLRDGLGGRMGSPITFDWVKGRYHGRDNRMYHLSFKHHGDFDREVEVLEAEPFYNHLATDPDHIPLHVVGSDKAIYHIDYPTPSGPSIVNPVVRVVEGSDEKDEGGTPINTWTIFSGGVTSRFSIARDQEGDYHLLHKGDMWPLESADNSVRTFDGVEVFYSNIVITPTGGVFALHIPEPRYIDEGGSQVDNPAYELFWRTATARPLRTIEVSGVIVDTDGRHYVSNSGALYRCPQADILETVVEPDDATHADAFKLELVDDTMTWTIISVPFEGQTVRMPAQYIGG